MFGLESSDINTNSDANRWYNPTSLQSVHMQGYKKDTSSQKWLEMYQQKPKRRAYNAGQLCTALSGMKKVGKEMVAVP